LLPQWSPCASGERDRAAAASERKEATAAREEDWRSQPSQLADRPTHQPRDRRSHQRVRKLSHPRSIPRPPARSPRINPSIPIDAAPAASGSADLAVCAAAAAVVARLFIGGGRYDVLEGRWREREQAGSQRRAAVWPGACPRRRRFRSAIPLRIYCQKLLPFSSCLGCDELGQWYGVNPWRSVQRALS
jgi:hypothetical protein